MVDEVSEFCELMQNFGQTMCKATSERTIDTPWSIYSENWKLPKILWKLPYTQCRHYNLSWYHFIMHLVFMSIINLQYFKYELY